MTKRPPIAPYTDFQGVYLSKSVRKGFKLLCADPFNLAEFFLHPPEISENQRSFDAFRGYRNRPVE